MRWSRGHTSGIEDRRSQGATGGTFGGGMGGIPIPMSVGGGGGLLIVVAIIVLNLLSSGGSGGGGGGLGGVLGQLGGAGAAEPGGTADLSNNGDEVQFMGYVLDDANGLWADTFQRAGKPYQPTTLVLFTGGTTVRAAARRAPRPGPFYCPADQKVYLDLDFFKELRQRFGAPGDFAEAYVVAHEVGHHVQQQSGIEAQVREPRSRTRASGTSCRSKLELQADCLAGVWAQSVYQAGDLEAGDIDEGLQAASAVGDDRIQAERRAGGQPRDLDARLGRAALELVQEGLLDRRPGGLRHVRRQLIARRRTARPSRAARHMRYPSGRFRAGSSTVEQVTLNH